jgi:hypothetical protein
MTTSFSQSTDVNQISGNGIDYGGGDESWTIETGVIVSSIDGSGVFSSFNQSSLINNGVIHSAANTINSGPQA